MELGAGFVAGCEFAQVAQVVLVKGKHEIEALEISAHELAGRARDGHSPPLGHRAAATVALLADVPGPGSRAVHGDLVVEAGLVHEVAHDRLGRGRAADVTHAHEAHGDGPGGAHGARASLGNRP